jgi:pimeloyl-ACP methyl ester carboxylesterase
MAEAKAKRPVVPELLARAAMASGIGYMAAAYTISRWLTRPTPSRPRTNPGNFGLPWRRVCCRTTDGIRLAGWVVEPTRPRATIALFHGMRGSRERVMDRVVFLARHRYRCVAFDLRAHGESGGRRTSFGFHESHDVAAVLDFIRSRWPRHPAAALGTSMGAAALCYAARQAAGWQAVILESCYQDIGRAFSSRLQHGYPQWYRQLSRGVIWVTERRLGLRLQQLAPVDHVADLAATPVFVLTGADDVHAPPEEAQELFERCRGPRDLWVVPGAGHRDVFDVGGAHYQERVLDFLTQHLAA